MLTKSQTFSFSYQYFTRNRCRPWGKSWQTLLHIFLGQTGNPCGLEEVLEISKSFRAFWSLIYCSQQGRRYPLFYRLINLNFELPELKMLYRLSPLAKFISEAKSKEPIAVLECWPAKPLWLKPGGRQVLITGGLNYQL